MSQIFKLSEKPCFSPGQLVQFAMNFGGFDTANLRVYEAGVEHKTKTWPTIEIRKGAIGIYVSGGPPYSCDHIFLFGETNVIVNKVWAYERFIPFLAR